MYWRALFLICVLGGVQTDIHFDNKPCYKNDQHCILRLCNNLLKAAVHGSPSLNMENLDPMAQEYIEGTFIIVKYKLYNSTIDGSEDCRVLNTEISLENGTMNFKMHCPRLFMYGTYDISGHLILVPIEGKGEFTLDTRDYYVDTETTIKIVENTKGQRFLQFKNFQSQGDLRGGMLAKLKNLFNGGNRELADAAVKFANSQWRPVAREFQGPVITANVKKIIKNMNKYLKVTPLNKFIIE